MAEFDLKDLEKIYNQEDILNYLVEKGIIKEEKFIAQFLYQKELHNLQLQLSVLQNYIINNNQRLLMIFEGRDAAGKGGAIQRIVTYLNPKKYKVIALPKPTEIERGQWYFERYMPHLPNAGEMVFFDRSWYNRAAVEPVFDFCTPAQYELFMNQVNDLEKLLIQDGIMLIKIFLSISKEEQAKRLEDRKKNPLKNWKVGVLDQQAQDKWDVYSQYYQTMFDRTSSTTSPWVEICTDDKEVARLQTIKYMLNCYNPPLPFQEKVDPQIVKIYT